MDRPRRRHGGGRRRARRPPRQPRPGPRRAPRAPSSPPRCTHRFDAVLRAREPGSAGAGHAAARRAGRHRAGRGHAGRRRPPRHRGPGHAVPGHDDVRRPGRPCSRDTCPTCRPASARCSDCAGCSAPSASRRRRRPVPDGPLDVQFRDLHFAYAEGTFALQRVDLHVPAGTDLRPGRPHRLRQVDPGVAALAGRRARARARCSSAASTCSTSTSRRLRSAVGVVTQRTEILAGTLAENIALFDDGPARPASRRAVAELGLDAWVAGLPDGLDTLLGPGGTDAVGGGGAARRVRPAAGARRPRGRARRGDGADGPGHGGPRGARPPSGCSPGRTGILVAHRLSTTERAEQVAVLDARPGRPAGPRARLAGQPGPFRVAARGASDARTRPPAADRRRPPSTVQVGHARRAGPVRRRRRRRLQPVPQPGPRRSPRRS